MVRCTPYSITALEQLLGTPSQVNEIMYPNALAMLHTPLYIPIENPIPAPVPRGNANAVDISDDDDSEYGEYFGSEYDKYFDYHCSVPDFRGREFDYPDKDWLADAYTEHCAEFNARTHILDVRKQETIDREKDNIQRQKRRAAQLTKKAKKADTKQENQAMCKKKRPSKKSGRRGSHDRDIVVW
jgi:hypothetical protein